MYELMNQGFLGFTMGPSFYANDGGRSFAVAPYVSDCDNSAFIRSERAGRDEVRLDFPSRKLEPTLPFDQHSLELKLRTLVFSGRLRGSGNYEEY
jgi:hypothetical protein